MDLRMRLKELAKRGGAGVPVVSVYLNTRWADEQQRDRVRLFLKNALRDARRGEHGDRLEAELAWIEAEAEALVAQERFPDADGVALFASPGGLRELIPVRAPFEDAFIVADTPYLRPLASFLEEAPDALVVFVDRERARLIPLHPDGAADEVTLEGAVPGQHRRGGWALLAQSRYQRHIEAQRDRHFEAVAETLAHLAEGHGAERLVLAGEPGTLAAFRDHLPEPLARRIAGSVTGTRYEPASVLVGRAAELLVRHERDAEMAALEAVLTEAAKGGRAAAGLEPTLDATLRGAVHRLYLLAGLRRPGRTCLACGTLEIGASGPCRACGGDTKPTELIDAIVDRVIATGGTIETLDAHPGLERAEGIAARLRYPV
jgi:peptide subunit release factor 1 (eRF1)